MKSPKILLFDIETSPNLAWVWGKYEQNVIEYDREWFVLCWSAKWLGSSKLLSSKLNDFKLYKKDKYNDYEVVKSLWKLFDEADIVIAHNGDKFDIKKTNARFLFHNLLPPQPFKSIDTLKIAKKYFKFNSNKLDDLGKHLNLGRKMKHQGFDTWLGCITGDKKHWNQMIRYNKQDVRLLEEVYNKFLPYIQGHPNLGLYARESYACPNCGSTKLQCRGFSHTKTNVFQRTHCQDCGAWSQFRKCEKKFKSDIKN